ncbi:hypothetical protein [Phnomibacter ginsenosidimutans]|uniref:Glycine zipper 2TM domain-containing protein n=1 Tax=Phnomibacter ginsenosidimutans TaxID=2676868 RepID=A0A6I6GUD9_9BACT|nr:hypothetical protein [Phnomibacter ginsenosidimutans]QGW28729.1 hypothetical protein GLV81_12030 [Phnomibacter ginsenosidimutans]
MKTEDEIIQSLIAGGIIGASLGVLIAKDKEEGAAIGALAGAVLVATYRASEKAKATNVPLIVLEEGSLYEKQADGTKRFIRKMKKPKAQLRNKFKLQ